MDVGSIGGGWNARSSIVSIINCGNTNGRSVGSVWQVVELDDSSGTVEVAVTVTNSDTYDWGDGDSRCSGTNSRSDYLDGLRNS